MNCKIMSIVLALMLLVSAVSALSVTGPVYSNVNQCDSFKQKYTVCADLGGVYNISVEGTQSNWIAIAPSSININADSCAEFYAFVTPECYANSGSYDFNIIVSGAESKSVAYNLFVNQAHTFNFFVSPSNRTSKPCEASDYNIVIRNTSKFVDEFVLVQKGLIDSWVTYPQTKFVINPYSSYVATMRVTTPCNTDANIYSFELGLFNTRTNASSKLALTKTITKFSPFIIDPLSESNKVRINSCEEFDKNVSFNIKNVSDKNDELTIELLDENYANLNSDIAYFEQKKVKLDFNSSSVVSLIIKKRNANDSNLMVKISSSVYNKSYFFPIEVILSNCYDLNIERVSFDETTCLSSVDSKIKFINTGSEKLDFNAGIYSNGVLIETKSVSVNSSSSVSEVFKLTSIMPSVSKVSVKVSTPFLEKTLNYDYEFKNCFDAGTDIDRILVCDNEDMRHDFFVTNEGTSAQKFKVSIDSNWIFVMNGEFDLNSGESKQINLYGDVPVSYADQQTILIESDEVNVSKTVPVITLTPKECYDLNFKVAKSVDANCCESKVVSLNIGNSGFFAQTIDLNAVAPSWVSVSETPIFILATKDKNVYLNLTPPAGTSGDFNVQVSLLSDKNTYRDVNFVVHVFGGNCEVPEGFDSDTNSKVTDLNGLKITEVKFDFVISNDSNTDFSVKEIFVDDLNAVVKFDSNRLLKPTESMTANIVAWFTGSVPTDKNVSVVIETSNGVITKTQLISFVGSDQSFSITGWFSAYTTPLLGLLLFAIFVIIVVLLFGPATKKKNGFRK